MNAPARLSLYGVILVIVFAVSGFTANTILDEDTVQAWAEETPGDHHRQGDDEMRHGAHGAESTQMGLGLAQGGYHLTEVSVPVATGAQGELSFVVNGPDGEPVSEFTRDHEQEMHLIVVRADGQHFRHVHPERDATGTWAVPWEWEAAGTYRVFADFIPDDTSAGTTLSTTVHVTGDYDPVPADQSVTETTVDGFDVEVEGDLVAGEASELIMTITHAGKPVTRLEPYLGAFGHLVVLRDGDLAYLHVHPHGDSPEAGETSGPEIAFEAIAPTPGRYLLFLDFQVDGQVHTAPLVIESAGGGTTGRSTNGVEANTGDENDDAGDGS